MCECLLTEWHLTPEYIFANWTSEKLGLMVEKLAERKKRELEAIKCRSSGHIVSDEQFFQQAGIKVKKVKK